MSVNPIQFDRLGLPRPAVQVWKNIITVGFLPPVVLPSPSVGIWFLSWESFRPFSFPLLCRCVLMKHIHVVASKQWSTPESLRSGSPLRLFSVVRISQVGVKRWNLFFLSSFLPPLPGNEEQLFLKRNIYSCNKVHSLLQRGNEKFPLSAAPITSRLPILANGNLDSIVVWWSLALDNVSNVTTGPTTNSCWEQAMFPIRPEITALSAGDEIEVKTSVTDNMLSFEVEEGCFLFS